MRPKRPYHPPRTLTRDEIGDILRVQSNYYWNPFSLLCGLTDAALPELSAPAWKVLTAIGIRQLAAAVGGQDAAHRTAEIALSIRELMDATRMSRMTVITAIRAASGADWLTQQKRRTPHGGNAVALYTVNWKRAEQAERRRRKS